MVDDRLHLSFGLRNMKVDQVVKKFMGIFQTFSMEKKVICDENFNYVLVTKAAGASKFYGLYQVGKEGLKPSIKKHIENKSFEKKTLQNVYDMMGKNYMCKDFLYGYMVIIKEVTKDIKKRAKICNGHIVFIYIQLSARIDINVNDFDRKL
eukprot:401789_1